MPLPLASRIALVTGASRGIGYATARALAKAGAHVIAVARTQGGLEELDDEIRKDGGSATLVPLNLTDSDGIARLGAALNERHGRLDILVGNAGVAGPSSPLGHIELKPWNDVMAVNVTANFQLIRCMEPLLKNSDAGRAVFVTSAAASKALAYLGPYAASKAALEALVRVWAHETASTADPRQPVQSRPDPHPHARHRVSRRRSADAGHAGTGRRIDPADVRAGLARDRQALRLPDAHADEFSGAGIELYRVPDAVQLFGAARRAGTDGNITRTMGPGSAAHRHSASKTRVNALVALRCVRGTIERN